MEPFLKWAGGKRWLAPRLSELAPTHFRRYFEPFLGGGAVALELLPTSAFLSDRSADLIQTYQVIQRAPRQLQALLLHHHSKHTASYYYEIRAAIPQCPIEAAGRFIYLNRTCWNGLYRVNRRGEFNVPRGTKTRVLYADEDFDALSRMIRNYEFRCSDFESAVDLAEEGDLLYADPPYTVAHNYNGFLKYNSKIFSWADQVRLEGSLRRAVRRGAVVYVSNADHPSIVDLYRNWPRSERLERHSVIAGAAKARKATTELLMGSQ